MKTNFPIEYPHFFTATMVDWKYLLNDDKHKEIIVQSLQFLVNNNRITLNAFVIMSNHIHLIWQSKFGFSIKDIQASFMKYTANQFRLSLISNQVQMLDEWKVNKYDRNQQFWKWEPLCIELRTHDVFVQKLDYIHYNPFKAGLCIYP
jgi:putative transposase